MVCFLRTIVLSLQTLMMIALLKNLLAPILNEVINNLEINKEKMFEWFSFNNLKANAFNLVQ